MNNLKIQQKNQTRSKFYILCRDKLLEAGFAEANKKSGHFFLQATAQTAFVINLDDNEDGLSVLYGFASTAYMAGDEDWFANYGSYNDSCQVRNCIFVNNDNEASAREIITRFYNQYKNYSKDEILTLKKERQKAFLNHFSSTLKPLGFRKRGTKWMHDLHDGTILTFEAQKSAFSDQYYFNVTVHTLPYSYPPQSYQRVVIDGEALYNWQLMTEKQIEDLIRCTVEDYLSPIIMK